jgi:hypothetical protein
VATRPSEISTYREPPGLGHPHQDSRQHRPKPVQSMKGAELLAEYDMPVPDGEVAAAFGFP